MPRRYRVWSGSFRFDKVAEYGGDWRMVASWSVLARVRKLPYKRLKHPCVNHHRTRPLCRIGTNPAIPDTSVACSARSATRLDLWVTGLRLHNLGAISLSRDTVSIARYSEIAPRLCRCSLVTHRSNRVTERAHHTTEVSGMAGFDRRRRTGRERWCLAHRVYTAFFGSEQAKIR